MGQVTPVPGTHDVVDNMEYEDHIMVNVLFIRRFCTSTPPDCLRVDGYSVDVFREGDPVS